MLSQPQAQPQTLSTPHSLSTTPTTTAPKIEKFNNHQKYAQCVNKNNATQKQNSQNNSSSNYSNGANQRRSSLNGNNQQATWNRRSSWFGGLASTERRHSLNPDAPPFIVNSDFNRFATNNSNSNSTANIASKDNNNKNQPKKQGYQNFNNSNNSNNTRRNSFGSYGSNNNKHYNNGYKNNNSRTNVYEAKFEGWLKNNDIRTETTFERNMSPISKSRKLNNWVKSVLIQKYVSKGDCVLDLGCGHGGDLLKFANRQISHYVGVDFAQNALSIAKERYLGIPTPPFAATFILHDSAQMCLTSLLDPTLSFDCVASQLALQYSYSNAESAKTYVHSAVDRLRHGGYFIGLIPDSQLLLDKLAQSSDGRTVSNPVYRVVFDKHRSELNLDSQPFGNLYRISIKNTLSEMPEYMVDMMSLEKMLNECGLELDLYMNVSDFYNSYAKVPQFTQLLHVMGVVDNYHPTVPKDQFELSCLFRVFVFKKQTCSKNTCKSKLSCNSDIVRENGICEKLTQSQNVGSQDSSR